MSKYVMDKAKGKLSPTNYDVHSLGTRDTPWILQGDGFYDIKHAISNTIWHDTSPNLKYLGVIAMEPTTNFICSGKYLNMLLPAPSLSSFILSFFLNGNFVEFIYYIHGITRIDTCKFCMDFWLLITYEIV